VEGTRKVNTSTRWRYEVEEDKKIVGIKKNQAMATGSQEWRKNVLKVKVHNRL
jgi:hypothetical protein